MRRAVWTALLAAASAAAQSPERLTLAQAEQMALKNQPAIAAARYSAEAEAESPTQVAAARLPTVAGNLTGAGAPDNSRLAAGGLNNPIIYSRVAGGFSVNQLLFDFGRTSHLLESSRLRAGAEKENSAAVRDRVLFDVRKAYFAALRSEAVVKVAERTLGARRLVVDQVTELEKAKLKSGLDVSFANVGLAEAKLLLSQAVNDRDVAYANLSATLGYATPRRFELVDEPFRIEPFSADELTQQALSRRPDLQASDLEFQAAQQTVKAERALRYPSVSAVGAAGWLPNHDEKLRARYGAAGINVSLPFLNGGLYRSRETEARLRAEAARERRRDLEIRIVRDIHLALANVNTAAERVGLTARLLGQAAQALDLAQARYDLGLSSIVELSQAQLAQTSAAIQNANAKYDYQIQRAVLDYQAAVAH